MSAAPEPGSLLDLPLTDHPDDRAEIRVLADAARDLAPHAPVDRPWPLAVLDEACLLEVHVQGRLVLPGAWVRAEEIGRLAGRGRRRVRAEDLRMPAFVLEDGADAVLAWGETLWELPFDGSVAIPEACRPGVHSLAQLRRLVMVALGRTADVGLTLWRAEGFEAPWHDVRLVPRARWWFSMAQVPAGMRYQDAARSQGVGVERLLP